MSLLVIISKILFHFYAFLVVGTFFGGGGGKGEVIACSQFASPLAERSERS